MRVRTKHTSEELLARAKIALDNPILIEFAESHEFPNGTQKATRMFGYAEKEVYSNWALAALKRDYPEIYIKVEAIVKWRANNKCIRTAPKGNAEEEKV